MKEQKRSDRGKHTTYIELAAEVVRLASRKFKGASFSAGFIVCGIGAKRQKIILTPTNGSVLLSIIMKDSKQEIRIFAVDPDKLFRLLQAEYDGSTIIQKNN